MRPTFLFLTPFWLAAAAAAVVVVLVVLVAAVVLVVVVAPNPFTVCRCPQGNE